MRCKTYYTDEYRIRYCVDGCGAHTRNEVQSFMVERVNGTTYDMSDSLVCPWCAEKEGELTSMAEQITGKDNRDEWIKGVSGGKE
jgi:hypothetical protein